MEAYRHTVQYYETDQMGITHHSNYIRFMEEARVDYLKKIGWDYAKLESMGVISPVTEVSCSYKHPSRFSDVLTIAVSVREFTGVRLRLSYRITNEAGQLVAEAASCHCFLNERGLPIRLRRDFPEFYEALSEQALHDAAASSDAAENLNTK